MDFSLFFSLIRNLLHMTVTEADEKGCQNFEASYCHLPALQDIFSEGHLQSLCEEASESCLYDLRDLLGVNALFVKSEGKGVLIGPFISQEYTEANLRSLLSGKGYAASYLPSLKLYYSELPLCSRKNAADTVLALLRSLSTQSAPTSIVPIRCGKSVLEGMPDTLRESIDYNNVYRRYEQENRFMRMIENGDSEHILQAFENLNTSGIDSRRYVSAIYQEPSVALAILRTLARKAAERGGASVVDIDEITQRATQSLMNAPNLYRAQGITESMLLELTDAVRRSREVFRDLSEPIRKTVEYLRLHYSQELNLQMLAKNAGLSESYLSTQFRRQTGQSLGKYLCSLRMEQAASLLRESKLPIQEISSFVGYSDNNYFIKVFRKYYGMTPGEYRRRE